MKSRKGIAGRSPVILPFPPRERSLPDGLIMEANYTAVVHGHVVRFVGQRWRADAFEQLPEGFTHDTYHEGEVVRQFVVDTETGEFIPRASPSEVADALRSSRRFR